MPERKSTHRNIMGIKILLLAAISLAAWGCVQTQPTATKEMPSPSQENQATVIVPMEQQAAPVAPVSKSLQNTDCAKCHDGEPADIETSGARHKTEIGCQDCHLDHPLVGTEIIPQCAMCHDAGDKEHFNLGASAVCLECHSNPHAPLKIAMSDTPETSQVCFTCHEDKNKEFQAFPSLHSEQNCTLCHPSEHKVIDKCFECHAKDEYHGGNGAFMVYEDCIDCHKPHSPLDITYSADTPSIVCGTCHGDLLESLSANKSKHNSLLCVDCHLDRHPTVPNCSDCHDAPHAASMLTSFNEDCLKCHNNPHDLIY